VTTVTTPFVQGPLPQAPDRAHAHPPREEAQAPSSYPGPANLELNSRAGRRIVSRHARCLSAPTAPLVKPWIAALILPSRASSHEMGGMNRERRKPPGIHSRPWYRHRWWRVFTLVFFVLLTPSSADVLEDVIASVYGVVCCDGGACSDEKGGACPQGCTHCGCCTHPVALPSGLAPLPFSTAVSGDAVSWVRQKRPPLGYRTPPFRPPVA
jgi:hypothetical protein